jgi:anti-sigma B factor antagonist
MELLVDKRGDTLVMGLQGQLVTRTYPTLKERVLKELERGEKKFVIDFSQTSYIDSTGLGALVSLLKKVDRQGGELRLTNLSGEIKSLFTMTKLDAMFALDDNFGEPPGGRAD